MKKTNLNTAQTYVAICFRCVPSVWRRFLIPVPFPCVSCLKDKFCHRLPPHRLTAKHTLALREPGKSTGKKHIQHYPPPLCLAGLRYLSNPFHLFSHLLPRFVRLFPSPLPRHYQRNVRGIYFLFCVFFFCCCGVSFVGVGVSSFCPACGPVRRCGWRRIGRVCASTACRVWPVKGGLPGARVLNWNLC